MITHTISIHLPNLGKDITFIEPVKYMAVNFLGSVGNYLHSTLANIVYDLLPI